MNFIIAALLVSGLFYGCGGSGAHTDTSLGTGSSGAPAAITVTSISPASGPTTGGTQITVTGTNFPTSGGITVTFGGTAATSVVVNSSTSATVTTPVHSTAGAVDVVVSASGVTPVTLTGGFTYFAVGAPLQISTAAALPDVVHGTAFSQQIVVTGGAGTGQTFAVTAGSLAAGLTLNSSTGLISGTPSTPGGSIFTITVTDATGSVSKQFTLLVADTLRITSPAALTDAIVNGTFNQQIGTTGGSGTQIWTVTSGALPTGLTLSGTTGVISGTPTVTGHSSFTIQVTDELQSASMVFTMNVNNPLRVPGAIQGSAFSFTPPAVTGATSWSVTSGTLPAGLSVNPADGTLSGTPTVSGTFNITLTATTASSSVASSAFLIVSPSAPAFGNTGNAYVGENPANLDPAATSVTTCGTLNANTSYKVTQNLGADATIACLTIAGAGVRLDLNGFTITGRIVMNADASGVSVFNGIVNCTWTDNGGDAGCVKILSQATPTAQMRLHHLTLHNSGGSEGTVGSSGNLGARSIHIDWAPPTLAANIVVRIYNVTSDVTNQPFVIRSHNVNVTGHNNVVEINSNSFTCGADGAACQGAVCDQVSDCRMHANQLNMIFNTTGFLYDSSRAMAFDTVTNGESWNNAVTTNNNRAVRVRDSTNVDIHDNVFNSIKNGVPGSTTPYVAAVHLADPDFGTDDLHVVVERNTFQMDNGTGIFIRNGIDAEVKSNIITCTAGLTGCTGIFAVARTPQVIACTPGTVRPGLICDGSTYQTIIQFDSNPTIGTVGLPSPQIQVAPGATANVCKSGNAGAGPGGTGTINNNNTCP